MAAMSLYCLSVYKLSQTQLSLCCVIRVLTKSVFHQRHGLLDIFITEIYSS